MWEGLENDRTHIVGGIGTVEVEWRLQCDGWIGDETRIAQVVPALGVGLDEQFQISVSQPHLVEGQRPDVL